MSISKDIEKSFVDSIVSDPLFFHAQEFVVPICVTFYKLFLYME